MLAGALDNVLAQHIDESRYEIIVVDNNSRDSTRQVVEGYIARGHSNLRYVFEPRQGVSHARNSGVTRARAPILAFTDDDVRVAPDWISEIKRVFDEHPEVDFLGGRILPRWTTQPPAWLTRDHWWALALLDYGEEPFYVSADKPLCLPTANASFRSNVFRRFGLFSPDFSGREDHEFLLRLWCGGSLGLYSPAIVVDAVVQPERLKKAYQRTWNATTGKFNSLMRLNEIMGPDGRIVGEQPNLVTLFGVPGFVYRRLLGDGLSWLRASVLGDQAAAQRSNNGLWYFLGYIKRRYEQNSSNEDRSSLVEITSFLKAMLRKKFGQRPSVSRTRLPEGLD
jgi:glycosyltransferase involved in cell wall biosynthesis